MTHPTKEKADTQTEGKNNVDSKLVSSFAFTYKPFTSWAYLFTSYNIDNTCLSDCKEPKTP